MEEINGYKNRKGIYEMFIEKVEKFRGDNLK